MMQLIDTDGEWWLACQGRGDEEDDVLGPIEHHRITGKDSGPYMETGSPDTLVIHYTAGGSAGSAIQTWERIDVEASAHLVIDRDGSVTQCVPLNRRAWHAGRSRWRAWTGQLRRGLNDYGIGIELVNPGRLENPGPDSLALRTWYRAPWPRSDADRLTHWNETEASWWAHYTEAQLDACQVLVGGLAREMAGRGCRIREVVGHDQIAPGRKVDPGPAAATLMADLRRVVQDSAGTEPAPGPSPESAGTPDPVGAEPAEAVSGAPGAVSAGDSGLPPGPDVPLARARGLRGVLQRLLEALARLLGQEPARAPESDQVAPETPVESGEDLEGR